MVAIPSPLTYPTGNVLYPKYKQAMVQQAATAVSLDQAAPNAVYCALLQIQSPNVNISYTYDPSHAVYTDLIAPNAGSPQSAVFNVGGSSNPGALLQQVLTPTLTPTGGSVVFAGANVTFLQVTSIFAGFNSVGALVLYRSNAGAQNTWRLIYYCDTGAGFPVLPNGGNVQINWNAGGIFAF